MTGSCTAGPMVVVPDAERRRQRVAYRRGLLRATAVAGVILAAMTGLTGWAVGQSRRAEAGERSARVSLTGERRAREAAREQQQLDGLVRLWRGPRK